MATGTLTVYQNSETVNGTGTSFITDAAPGGFMVFRAGGVDYTLPVQTVVSNTQLKLVSPFRGIQASGLTWDYIPQRAMSQVTAALVTQSAEAMRGMNLDKQNWQQLFSGTGTITVKLPDGSTFTGPAWSGIVTELGKKAGAGANSDIKSLMLDSFRLATNILFTSNKIEVGGSAYLDLEPRNSNWVKLRIIGGYNSRRGINGIFGDNTYNFDWGGPTSSAPNPFELWVDGSRIGQVAFTTPSDKWLKKDIVYLEDTAAALDEVVQWRPASFKYRARGILRESDTQYGFIAQDIVENSPEVVRGEGLKNDDYDPDNPAGSYTLDQMAIIMKLTQAIQHQQKQIKELQEVVKQFS
jgi:hypothetical protein